VALIKSLRWFTAPISIKKRLEVLDKHAYQEIIDWWKDITCPESNWAKALDYAAKCDYGAVKTELAISLCKTLPSLDCKSLSIFASWKNIMGRSARGKPKISQVGSRSGGYSW
jgi:hypothetical protein